MGKAIIGILVSVMVIHHTCGCHLANTIKPYVLGGDAGSSYLYYSKDSYVIATLYNNVQEYGGSNKIHC